MKLFRSPALLVSILALAFVPARAAGPSVDLRLDRLHELVSLTSAQKAKAAEVFRREDAELAVLPAENRPLKGMEARQASRDRVRALLTPAQQKIYDRAPQLRGGGLTLPTPETRVANLDATVTLTAAQKGVALQIFQEEFESLLALAPADRPAKGVPFRQAARDQVRALLTPAQLAKMDDGRMKALEQDNDERAAVENLLRASHNLLAKIGPIVRVTPGGSASTSESSNGSRQGTYTLRVVGETGTETLLVAWQKTSATAPLRIVRATIGGTPFQL